MKIVDGQDVIWKGIYIPLRLLKEEIIKEFGEESLIGFQIDKKFNAVSGKIDRKYAWDNIILTFYEEGKLDGILLKLCSELRI